MLHSKFSLCCLPHRSRWSRVRWNATSAPLNHGCTLAGLENLYLKRPQSDGLRPPKPAGRGRRRKRTIVTIVRPVHEGLLDDPPIATLSDPSSSIPMSSGDISLQDVQYIGSYNWMDSRQPTIIVPGSPRVWRDDELPYTVPQHEGNTFIDENRHRMGERMLMPLVAAVDFTSASNGDPPFDWSSVDIVTDRGNLRRFIDFLKGRRAHGSEPFRIDVQLAGKKTLLLNRWKKKTIGNCWSHCGCYSHNFEKASTKAVPGFEHGHGHHRIIAYTFDGLRIVVRSEVDAYIAHAVSLAKDTAGNFVSPEAANGDQPPISQSYQLFSSSLRIAQGGTKIPQSWLAEIKASKRGSIIQWSDIFPQLYLSQTHHIIQAAHREELFHRVRLETLDSEAARLHQQQNENTWRRLGPLIRTIRDIVVARGHGARLSIVGLGGKMEIRERKTSRSCLPEEILQRFDVSS